MADPSNQSQQLKLSFSFCPKCCSPGPTILNDRQRLCPTCGFQYFFNCAAATGAFLFFKDQLILAVREREPKAGYLDVPGGFLDFNESAEEGLQREIKEELNLHVTSLRYFMSAPNDYEYGGVPYKTMDLFFIGYLENVEGIQAADDVNEYVLISPESLDPQKFAFDSTRKAFLSLLAMRNA